MKHTTAFSWCGQARPPALNGGVTAWRSGARARWRQRARQSPLRGVPIRSHKPRKISGARSCTGFHAAARPSRTRPNLFLVYCSVEKLMHQRSNPTHFFFQREMARVQKMELCTGNIFFKEFSTLHREDSIVFAPSDQRGGLLFTEILLPVGEDIQIPS